ncbi:MAG: TonB-dependent receptor, partial [Pedobacter sp.]
TSFQTDESKRRAATHSLGGLLEWKPDTIHTLRYRPTLTFSPQNNNYNGLTNLFNTQTPRLSETIAKIQGESDDQSFAHEFWYYLKMKKGRTLTFNHTLALNTAGNDEYNYSNLNSFSNTINSSLLDRFTNSDKVNNSAGFWVVYNLPLSKVLTAELFSNSRYLHTSEALFTYDKSQQTGSYDIFLPVQSNDFLRQGFFQNLKPLLNFQFGKSLRVRTAIDLEFQYVLNTFNASVPDIGKRYLMLFPSLSIDYNRFSLSYSEWIDHPSIYNMQPITREMSPLYTFVGNPELVPSKQRQTRANYYNYIPGKMMGINGFASLVMKEDNFVQKTTVSQTGATLVTTVNQGSAVSANFGTSVNKQFKKSQNLQLSLATSAQFAYNSYTVFLNADQGEQDSYFFALAQNLNFNYKSAIILNSNYSFRKSLVSYDQLDYNSVSTYGHVLGASGMFRLPKRIIIDAKYNFSYNPQVAAGFPKSSHIVN